MHLWFGMEALGREGDAAGVLDRALLDASTREITHLVVRSGHVSEDVLVPLSLVQGDAGGRLLLHVGSDELSNLPRYYEGRTSSPPAGRMDTAPVREPSVRRGALEQAMAVPADALQLDFEVRVTTVDGAAGRLAGVATEEYTHRLSQLDLEGITVGCVRVPALYIGALGDGAIALMAQREQLLEQPLTPPAGAYVAQESAGG